MGSHITHVPYFREDIKDLALDQEYLFHFERKHGLKDLTEKLNSEGFQPYAVSSGNEPLNKILDDFEVAKEAVRVIDCARVSKRFNPGEAYLVYKYEDVKIRSPGSLSGAPLQVAHCGRYSA